MVLFMPKENFHAETMTQITELRRAGSLCDVTLTVGQNKIQAHRCVLAARSEYFRTAFLGQFREASTENINLSEVTSDVRDLVQVVDFMYTGNIEINDDNLQVLMELSMFLLMKSLRENCLKYMKDHASLKTCLNHYMHLCCVEHSLDETEEKMRQILLPRFHDYFIHEDNLDLTPDEVQVLLSKNMFKHCTVSTMLQFVYKWLADEATNEHISVASQILDIVDKEFTAEQQTDESKVILVKIKEKINETGSGVNLFQQKVQISMENFPKLETERSSCERKSEPSSANIGHLSSDYEDVIVTLSPRQCVVDGFHKKMDKSCYSPLTTEQSFTLCCYVPRTKAWHHIEDFTNHDQIPHLPDSPCCQCYTCIPILYEGKLGLLSDCYLFGQRLFFHHFSGLWEMKSLHEMDEHRENESLEAYAYCLINGNSCLYLIVKMVLKEREHWCGDLAPSLNPKGEYFVGFRLGDDDNEIQKIFQTQMVRRRVCVNSELQAKFSSVSNELIFTCGQIFGSKRNFNSEDCYSYVFIVNLNDEDPVALDLAMELEQVEVLIGHKILQTETHFYIVYDGTAKSRYRDVRILYEYEFHSLRLTKPQYATNQHDDSTTLSDEAKQADETEMGIRINKLEGNEEDMFPCCEELTVSNGNSLWSFEGDRHYFSGLHEVQVEGDGSLKCTEHTPPPFSCVTRMTVGQLPTGLVAQWTPVRKFLHRTDSVLQ